MDTEVRTMSLEQIPATRRLLENLYAHGMITCEAKEHALDFLYPHTQWGEWVSRLLLIVGVALILSGIVYFFAFNWAKITPALKFSSIQLGIVGCLLGAYFCSLQKITGQLLLLGASVLVGVFMAVFGQVYQTGADAYQLFMMWSLLILGWTLISNFAAQWVLWLLVSNLFLWLWWQQAAQPTQEMEAMLLVYMSLFNGMVLALREYLSVSRGADWLQSRWTRALLVITVLITLLVSVVVWIIEDQVTLSIVVAGSVGLIGHGIAYSTYRYFLPDMWALAATVFSVCIIAESLIIKMLLLGRFWRSDAGTFLIMGLLTLGVFSLAIIYLRQQAKNMEAAHV